MKTKEIRNALLTNDPIIIENLYEDIYNEYYKLLFYVVIKITKNEEDTKEIVIESFRKAFNNIDKFDFNKSDSNFKAWLVRIAKNEAINYMKKYNKASIDYLDEDIKATNSDFDKFVLEFKEILNQVELDILIFRIKYNMKLIDIAEIYQTDTNHIYNIYKQALRKLKKYYKLGDFNEHNKN